MQSLLALHNKIFETVKSIFSITCKNQTINNLLTCYILEHIWNNLPKQMQFRDRLTAPKFFGQYMLQ